MEEMYRVCKPGGKILITDITVDKNKKDKYNKNVEKIRALSYTEALKLEDILEKIKALGAINIQSEQFDLKTNMKTSLSLSSHGKPNSNNENIRFYKQETEVNNLESKNCKVDDHVHYNLPMSTIIGQKKK